MLEWSADYTNDRLPSTIRVQNVDWHLKISSGFCPYIIQYEGWKSIFDDRPDCLVQSFGSTEEGAVEQMVQKLKEMGIEI